MTVWVGIDETLWGDIVEFVGQADHHESCQWWYTPTQCDCGLRHIRHGVVAQQLRLGNSGIID